MSAIDHIRPIQKTQLKLDLFSLDPLLDKNFSNTIEIYDLVGKYVYNKKCKTLKQATAKQTHLIRHTVVNGLSIKVTLTAASMENAFVFPGAREEIVEDVLRKLATERRSNAYQDAAKQKFVGLNFTLYEVFNELKRIGKTYSYTEIKEALLVMHKSNLSIESEDKALLLSSTLLPILTIKERNKSFVCFHPMISDSIETLTYRRYNYLKSFEFKSHYTRQFYKRLCHRWIQASPTKPYNIKLSTLVESNKNASSVAKDKNLYIKCLNELVATDILSHYKAETKKEGRKIIDWLFILYASETFTQQIRSNNKVVKNKKELPIFIYQ